jgi:subtilisin family serine protease
MWDLQIMPLKIVESNKTGGAPLSNVAEAFNYARTNGAGIINYSGSGTNPFGPRSEAAYNAYASGMIIVSSAGNDYKGSINYPAALHTSIGVGATDQSDTRHSYSNYGSRLDISAPSGFETTSRGNNNDLYDGFGGTSQAAPVVSGLAGLLFAESRDEGHNLFNNDVVHLLERTADNVQAMNGDFDVEFGHGRVNAYEVSHGTASFTKIYNDDQVSFPDGFTTETGVSFGAGHLHLRHLQAERVGVVHRLLLQGETLVLAARDRKRVFGGQPQ